MKKFLFILFGVFAFSGAFAAGENVPTSKDYVDAAVAIKQDIIPANDDAPRVLTNTGTAGEYGTKGIYDSTGEYAAQTQNLVDAGTMNTAVQNAIDSEFQCIEWLDPNDHSSDCLLFNIFGPSPQQIIPREYTQLEYLESTGTQYIDTGIAPTNTTGLRVKFNKKIGDDQVVVGVLGSSTSTNSLYVNPASTNLYIPFAQSYYSATYGTYTYNTDYTVSVNYNNNRKRYVNGVNFLDITTTLTSSDQSLYLFAGHRVSSNSAHWFLQGRIYYLQITEGMNTVRNFIPARRDSDGVLGMYDTVSNTFFTNNGTGEFIAGPMVNLYLPTGE